MSTFLSLIRRVFNAFSPQLLTMPLLSFYPFFNSDYNELKGMLTWEGSSVASMSAKEALFVTAVAASRRGDPLLSDDKYIALKHELQAAGSWVTARQQDSLERLGLQTFLGYLHGSLAAES